MKAIAYKTPGPIDREGALQDITLEKPIAADRDLLIKIHAVAINPVDTKQRKAVAPPDGGWRVLGFHAAGVVDSVGPEAKNFKPGDAVFDAGTINWPGTNAEYHLVDERIVGLTPATPSDEQAAVAQKRHHGRVHNPPGRLKALSERGGARRSALQRRLRSRRDHGCLRIAPKVVQPLCVAAEVFEKELAAHSQLEVGDKA